jgi:Domain of unknown function (DUF3854)
MDKPKLTTDDLKLFGRFKIPQDLLSAAEIFRVSDPEARSFGFQFWPGSDLAGIVYPYFDPITRNRVTSRLRRDKPDLDEKGREDKYIFPRGDNCHIYFPPGVGEFLGDSKVPVAFVEAEKSALALLAWASRTGQLILPLATGGCWGWRGKPGAEDEFQDKDRRGALSDFNRITWERRDVYIIFDSNVSTNPRVARARVALAKELAGRGAKVYLVALPQE